MHFSLKVILATISLFVSWGIFACSGLSPSQKQRETKPNIIYILADDLGYGDLSCYGQTKFKTPNIDKLASRGMKFTWHYSGSTLCAPSRSSLMTGEHTGHTPIRGNRELMAEGQLPLPAESFTIAELLKSAGYRTGGFGKWGLGFIGTEGDPNKQGFDEFYGYNCQRMAHRYYPPYLWHNQDKVPLEGNDWTHTETYAPDLIQEATLQFIEKNSDTSFFAYVPLVLPHAELISPDDSLLNKYSGKFEEKPFQMPESYLSDYGPNIETQKYSSQMEPHAVYASMVSRLDIYVGQIVEKLEELGISDNTILMFASDNGPYSEGGGDPVFFNSTGNLRGKKRDLYEGGIRSPFIVVWPNQIEAGSISTHVSAFWDIMPTFAEIAGVQNPENHDGISILPTLMGDGNQAEHDYLYWEYNGKGGRKAVRKDDWKGIIYNVKKNPQGEFQLFNLGQDSAEEKNVASEHPEIVAELLQIMGEARTQSELFPL